MKKRIISWYRKTLYLFWLRGQGVKVTKCDYKNGQYDIYTVTSFNKEQLEEYEKNLLEFGESNGIKFNTNWSSIEKTESKGSIKLTQQFDEGTGTMINTAEKIK